MDEECPIRSLDEGTAENFVDDVLRAREQGLGAFLDDSDPAQSSDDLVWFDGKRDQIILVEGSDVLSTREPWNKLSNVFAQTFYLESGKREREEPDLTKKITPRASCDDM